MWVKFFGPLLADAYHVNVADAQKKLVCHSRMVSSRTCAGSPPIYVRSSTVDLYGKESHTIYDDKLETHGGSFPLTADFRWAFSLIRDL